MKVILGANTDLLDSTFHAVVFWTQSLAGVCALLTSPLIFMFTSEETRVVDWSWVDILISHLVFIPTVESHIFLPLLEPVSVHEIPVERARNVMSVPPRRGLWKLKFKCGAIPLKWWHRVDSCNNSGGVWADLTLQCFSSGQLAPWFGQVFFFRLRPARVMESQTGKPLEASPGLASRLTSPKPGANYTKKPRRGPAGNVSLEN